LSKPTKAFLAGARIATHFGRPGTPNDQAWIESLSGHVKTGHPHLERIRDPGELEAELDRVRGFYNTVRPTTASATSPRKTNTPAVAKPSAPPAAPDCNAPTRPGSPPGDNYDRNHP
jgi:transposase InsO family protein